MYPFLLIAQIWIPKQLKPVCRRFFGQSGVFRDSIDLRLTWLMQPLEIAGFNNRYNRRDSRIRLDP